jgi:acyl-CoA reductase-like NAD-dependent aldehyde dehydrogenase
MNRFENFINGRWIAPTSGSYYKNCNPAKPQTVLAEFPSSAVADVDAAVEAASEAFKVWRNVPGPQRGMLLYRFAQLLDDTKEELGRIITLEQGKALTEAVGEVVRAANEARFMAGEASRIQGHTFPSERAGYSCHTILEPIGVVAAISPWNFPVVTPVRKIAPALAFGNTIVFKPASLTPWSAVFLTQLFDKAGFPSGVLNLVIGSGRSVGDRLVNHHQVKGITFTGSTAVGVSLFEQASKRMAKVQLELGGKNPAIVWDYNDLDGAAKEIVTAAFLCSGQRCTALSRIIVSEGEADALAERVVHHTRQVKVGDGLEGGTMGPLVSHGQIKTVEEYVQKGIQEGANLLYGGHRLAEDPDQQGYYHEPTVFDQVDAASPLAQEEIFGPVLPILRVASFDQAIEIANSTRYGLAASLFTSRMKLAHHFIQSVEAGMLHVNHGTTSQAHVPFGGVKESGYGAYSIGPTVKDFYTNLKSVYVRWEE